MMSLQYAVHSCTDLFCCCLYQAILLSAFPVGSFLLSFSLPLLYYPLPTVSAQKLLVGWGEDTPCVATVSSFIIYLLNFQPPSYFSWAAPYAQEKLPSQATLSPSFVSLPETPLCCDTNKTLTAVCIESSDGLSSQYHLIISWCLLIHLFVSTSCLLSYT